MTGMKQKNKIYILVFSLFLLSSSLIAADDNKYPVATIPDSLKQGAFVVVRENSLHYSKVLDILSMILQI